MEQPSFLYKILHNPLACSGLVITLCMSLLIIFAPLFTTFSPTDQLNWLGAKPPGFTHPDVLVENRFEISQPPESTKKSRTATQIEIHQTETVSSEIRIVASKQGVIKDIRMDNKPIDSINLQQFTDISEISGDTLTPRTITETIEVNAPAPEQLLREGQRVLLLKIVQSSVDNLVTITLEKGIVKKIISHKESIERVAIKGADITQITIDGKTTEVQHLLGTDEMGRDLFARILYGGRISLMVGVVATLVSLIIGVLYGAISGYIGGKTDRFLMSTIDILYAIPFMFLVIILMVSFGRSLILLFVALGAVQWLTMARIVRGQILGLKEMEFVEAARMCGSPTLKIILKHLLPHTLGPVIVYASLTVPIVILEESFLAFIGLQVQMNGLSLDSWGSLIDNGIKALGQDGERMWLLLYPSLAMLITLFGLNAFGDGLSDILNPRAKQRSN